MNKVKSIMIVGVGGQGTLLASRILGNALLSKGYDIKISEVHGMSQRGGSVVTYVRFGEKVHSPIIDLGEADIILSFEQLEAARYLPYLKTTGTIITNVGTIDPMTVISGKEEYPKEIIESIKNTKTNIIDIDALELANKAGNAKAVNVVLLGVLAKHLSKIIDKDFWIEAINKSVPEKFIEVNLRAFELGYN